MAGPHSIPNLISAPLRLPLAAGAIVFLVAVLTTQIALYLEGKESDARLKQIGAIYLDGLAASVRPALPSRRGELIAERFAQAFSEQHGIRERALFAFGSDRVLLTKAGDPTVSADRARAKIGATFHVDTSEGIAWASRSIDSSSGIALVAALDISGIISARARTMLGVIALDFLIATISGFIAYLVLRRMNRPFEKLAEHLETAASGNPMPICDADLSRSTPQVRPLFTSFNRLLEALREREGLAAELAEQSQTASLGRLAATVAHEVRNPLAGMTTAVSTLRRFGNRPEVREESLGFLERGLEALDRIVTSTLNLYRPENERELTMRDFDDLERLVRPAVVRAHLDLGWRVEIPERVSIGAVGVRQVLLNLLLNACAATLPGGRIELSAGIEGMNLVCIISDQGRGMQPESARQLAGGIPAAENSRRIGMDVVIALLGDVNGRASVTSIPGRGTSVKVTIPLRDAAP